MAKSWLDRLVDSTKDAESPERYFWWSGIAALAATIGKNLSLDRRYYKLYPNVYVILVSSGSGLRKGLPVSLISQIMEDLSLVRVIEGRGSIQAVIAELATQRTLENGIVLSTAQGLMCTGEFDTFLIKDSEALTILTALYNTHEHNKTWKNSLKTSPVETLKSPCLSMLAASNEVLFNDLVKGKDVEGGFIARSFIVYENKRRGINPLVYVENGKLHSPEKTLDLPELVDYLRKEVHTQIGEFKWTIKAAQTYIPYYTDLCNLADSKNGSDKTGSMNRLGDQILKVAMLISIAKDADLTIKKDDIEEAIEKCEECIMGTKRVTMGSGTSDAAPGIAQVMKLLMGAPEHKLARKRILQRCWPDMDYIMLDRVIETLQQSGTIEILHEKGTGAVYKMPEKIVRQWSEYQKGGD